MYKIDNKYQKAKIKNLEYRLDFQKYNIKEKKKKKKKSQELLKNNKTTTKRLYTVFALKIRSFFFWKVIVGYKNKN